MTSTRRPSRSRAQALLEEARDLIAAALAYPWHNIVDFGCGEGLHTAEFAKAGRIALGVDMTISTEAATAANRGRYTLLQGSWWDLQPRTFDAGYSHHCLEHLRDPIGALHQWGQIVRPNGILFLAVPTYRPTVAAGHIATGWNIGQVAYCLAAAGFDCRAGRFRVGHNAVWAIVDRPQGLQLCERFGELKLLLPRGLNWNDAAHYCGEMTALNW